MILKKMFYKGRLTQNGSFTKWLILSHGPGLRILDMRTEGEVKFGNMKEQFSS